MKLFLLALSIAAAYSTTDPRLSLGLRAPLQDPTPEYKVLVSDISPPVHRPRTATFRVSVKEALTQSAIQKVICSVLLHQHLTDITVVRVFLYLQLDHFFADVRPNPRNKEVYDKAVAAYFWNENLLDSPHALQIYKDHNGKDLPDGPNYYRFD